MTIRYLNSTNSVPAILQEGSGMVNLQGGTLSGSGPYAIARTGGQLFVRSTTSSGYGATIQGVSGTSITEYASATREVFPSQKKSLALPAQETPTYFDTNFANWRSTGGSSGGDDTAAIQAAMSSGKSTIYFPKGIYRIRDTITVGPSVRHVLGMEAFLQPASGHLFTSASNPRPLFRFTNSNTLVFERIRYGNFGEAPGAIGIEQAGSTLVVKDVWMGGGAGSLRGTSTANLFFENAVGPKIAFTKAQNVWARQLNIEARVNGMIQNSAAKLWILGLKTEEEYTAMTLTGGQTEVLGGLLYPTNSADSNPAFIISNCSASLSFLTTGGGNYGTIVRETQSTTTGTLSRSACPTRGDGVVLPLFRTGTPATQAARTVSGQSF